MRNHINQTESFPVPYRQLFWDILLDSLLASTMRLCVALVACVALASSLSLSSAMTAEEYVAKRCDKNSIDMGAGAAEDEAALIELGYE